MENTNTEQNIFLFSVSISLGKRKIQSRENMISDVLNSDPLVSIIMPSCNSEAYIEKSITSVLQQTHRQLELIVVDDGSHDKTLNIVNDIAHTDPRLILVPLTETSGGPAKPRNLGLQNASGSYLAFIDSDDVWHSQKLAIQLQAMKEFQLNFVSTHHHAFRGSDIPSHNTNQTITTYTKNCHETLIKKNNIVTSSALIALELAGDLRFDESEQSIAIEDYIAWLYLHQKSTIRSGILANKLVFYRLRNDSISTSKVIMAKKIYNMLQGYQIDGDRLGWRAYYYFLTYLVIAVKTRIIKNTSLYTY